MITVEQSPMLWNFERSQQALSEIIHGTDRSRSLVAGALLDGCMEELLANHFVKLSKSERDAIFRSENAPLATFAAKTRICHALGYIEGHTRDLLDDIRKIRNVFAHTVDNLNFGDLKLDKLFDRLRRTVHAKQDLPNWRIFILAVTTAMLEILQHDAKRAEFETKELVDRLIEDASAQETEQF